MHLIHPKDLQLDSPEAIDDCITLWESLDFEDPTSVEEMNRFFTSDVFQWKDAGDTLQKVNYGTFVAFLRNVQSVADPQRRRDTMLAFINLRDDIVKGRPLTQDDLALCRKFELGNLAGAEISDMEVPHSLEADLARSIIHNLRVVGNLSILRVDSALNVSATGSVSIGVAENNVLIEEAGDHASIGRAGGHTVEVVKAGGKVHIGEAPNRLSTMPWYHTLLRELGLI